MTTKEKVKYRYFANPTGKFHIARADEKRSLCGVAVINLVEITRQKFDKASATSVCIRCEDRR